MIVEAAPRRQGRPAGCGAAGRRFCGPQKQLGDYLDAVVAAAPIDSAAALVSAADADAAGQVADAITATLRPDLSSERSPGRPR